MPSNDFFAIKKVAMEYINLANDVVVIEKELDIISNEYTEAQFKVSVIKEYMETNLSKLKMKNFEKIIVEKAVAAAINEMEQEASNVYFQMMEDRYKDIIKIYDNGSTD